MASNQTVVVEDAGRIKSDFDRSRVDYSEKRRSFVDVTSYDNKELGHRRKVMDNPFLQCAVGIIYFSVIIALEGNFRAAVMIGPVSQGATLSFPPEALLAGGLAELALGLMGIFVAGAVVSGVRPSPFAVKIILILEALLGWFVFILFVFVNPAMDAAEVQGIPFPWETRQSYDTFVAMGILTAAGYCAMLLGGQYIFTIFLLYLAKGQNKQTLTGLKVCGIAFSGLHFFTGLWIFIAGVNAGEINPGPLYIFQPPLFIIYNQFAIATGVWMCCVGIFGIVLCILKPIKFIAIIYAIFVVLCNLWQIAVLALYQPPVMGFGNASTSITGLILSHLFPAYLILRRAYQAKETGEDEVGLLDVNHKK